MKFSEVVHYSYIGLRHRQGRFWLTILGIVIGIASVVALLTIGEGFNAEVNKQLSTLNGNTIYIVPIAESQLQGGSFGNPSTTPYSGKLTDKDVDRLKRIPEVTAITRLSERRATLAFKGKNITATVSGYEPGVFEQITTLDITEGRSIVDSDRGVVLMGGTAAREMFGTDKPVKVNSVIGINGRNFRVVGILKETGGGFGSDLDNGVLVHFEDTLEIFKGTLKRGEMDAIALAFADGSDLNEVVSKIKSELDSSHKVRPEERDYSVIDPQFLQQSIGSVLSLITVFLGAIAGISLVVGGLAIASSMFTSVIERTREIGVLKSVGATEEDIRNIFLFESGALGMAGGITGTALALAVVYVGSLFGLPAQINTGIAAFGIAFAFGVGLLSGYFPARQAAKLSPVEAFRYE